MVIHHQPACISVIISKSHVRKIRSSPNPAIDEWKLGEFPSFRVTSKNTFFEEIYLWGQISSCKMYFALWFSPGSPKPLAYLLAKDKSSIDLIIYANLFIWLKVLFPLANLFDVILIIILVRDDTPISPDV